MACARPACRAFAITVIVTPSNSRVVTRPEPADDEGQVAHRALGDEGEHASRPVAGFDNAGGEGRLSVRTPVAMTSYSFATDIESLAVGVIAHR